MFRQFEAPGEYTVTVMAFIALLPFVDRSSVVIDLGFRISDKVALWLITLVLLTFGLVDVLLMSFIIAKRFESLVTKTTWAITAFAAMDIKTVA